MATILWPSIVPCPQTSTVTPAERRALSNPDRPREARVLQRDRLEYERITFPPLNPAQSEAFLTFWRDDLQRGGSWFLATWPLPRGRYVQAVRKFKEQPKWQYVPGGFWQISALCEVRGRGELSADRYYTSLLYPVIFDEALGAGISTPVSGRLWIPPLEEFDVGLSEPISGTIDAILVIYDDYVADEFDVGVSEPVSGTLDFILTITYDDGAPDELDVSVSVPQSGTIAVVLVVYDNWPVDEFDVGVSTPQSGTLE